MSKITLLTASAGTGKTHSIVQLLTKKVTQKTDAVRPEAIVGTTFTVAAAAELADRIRTGLNAAGHFVLSRQMHTALLGTVHSVCDKLVRRYAFEAGLSPEYEIMDAADSKTFFDQSIMSVVLGAIDKMEDVTRRFGFYEGRAEDRRDWRSDIKAVVEMARANGISPADLQSSAKQSIDITLSLLPTPAKRSTTEWNAKLKLLLDQAIAALEAADISVKKTQEALDFYKDLSRQLEYTNIRWRDWQKLTEGAGQKADKLLADLLAFVAEFPSNRHLREDISEYVTSIFELAAESMTLYQDYKRQRGLADYTDLETMALQILENVQVCSDLKDRIDLFLVDEFQDTSPIQLKLFLKLSQLAREAVWAGDAKQAIYGFRNTDPELMQAVLAAISGENSEMSEITGTVEHLQNSFRTRKPLVEFFNAIFTRSFSNLKSAEVTIMSARYAERPLEEETLGVPLRLWQLNGSKVEEYVASLAAGIKSLIAERPLVSEKNQQDLRALIPGDIAILCRTNKECKDVAAALSALGIETALPLSGIGQTDEFALLSAILRLYADTNDTLARAEILLLTQPGVQMEDILNSRRADRSREEWDKHREIWLDNYAIISQVVSLRARAHELTVCEITNFLIERLDLLRLVGSWGQAMQRMMNIEKIRTYATAYEEHCSRMMAAATIPGFVSWLNELAESAEDKQGHHENRAAVVVDTYHGAKGLEWPVVITYSMGSELRDSIWGISVQSTDRGVDLRDPLKNRFIRFLPWFLSPLKKNPDWLAHEVTTKGYAEPARCKAIDEDRRLLYVGFTRARDYLIIPRAKDVKWFTRIFPSGTAPDMTVENGSIAIGQTTVPALERTFNAETAVTPTAPDFTWFNARSGTKEHQQLVLSPSSAESEDKSAETSEPVVYAERLPCNIAAGDEQTAGDVIHRFLAADRPGYSPEQRKTMAYELIIGFEASAMLNAEGLVARSSDWQNFLAVKHPDGKILREIPIKAIQDKQHINGIIDLLVETPAGVYIYDHKSFPGQKSDWSKYAANKAGQLMLYRAGLEKAGKKVLGAFIHFVVGGGVVEVILK